jgi:hypothetical protein
MQEAADEKKNELLSAFNVATFQSDVKDEDFWNSIITDEHRKSLPENHKRKKSKDGAEDGEAALRNGRRSGGDWPSASKGVLFCILVLKRAGLFLSRNPSDMVAALKKSPGHIY